jgi:hypothetical protein
VKLAAIEQSLFRKPIAQRLTSRYLQISDLGISIPKYFGFSQMDYGLKPDIED